MRAERAGTLIAALVSMAAFGAEPVTIDTRATFFNQDGTVSAAAHNITSFTGDGTYTRVMSAGEDPMLGLEPTVEMYDAKTETFFAYSMAANVFYRQTGPGQFTRTGYQGRLPSDLPTGPTLLGYRTVVMKQGNTTRYHAPDLYSEPLLEEGRDENGALFYRMETTAVHKSTLPKKYFEVRSDAQQVADALDVFDRHAQKRELMLTAPK
jgi:hypothetical protein